jgi:hypothetical protein
LARQARPYWSHIAGVFFLSLLATPLALLTPVPLKIAVDTVLGDYPNVAPAHLAAAWADQMWHRDSAMRRRIVDRLQPAATAFLALVEREAVDLHTTEYDLDQVNEVAEKLHHREIDGRAVIVP